LGGRDDDGGNEHFGLWSGAGSQSIMRRDRRLETQRQLRDQMHHLLCTTFPHGKAATSALAALQPGSFFQLAACCWQAKLCDLVKA